MKLTKEEIAEELTHQAQVIQALRARRRILELQAAQHGNQTPPHILTELAVLTQEIGRHEDEITELETLAAEDQAPLAEVEYRVLLAETWDTPRGRPSVAGAERLELARLRLGILPELAKQLEQEICRALAEEALLNMDTVLLGQLYGKNAIQKTGYKVSDKEALLQAIGRAVRLDVLGAVHAIVCVLEPKNPHRYINPKFIHDLLQINRVREDLEEYNLFQEFWHLLNSPVGAYSADELEQI